MITSVEVMVGLIFVVLGISIMLRPAIWGALITRMAQSQDHSTILAAGSINLALGAFIVSFHWVWSGLSAIITLIGVLLLLRAAFLMYYPAKAKTMIVKMQPQMSPLLNFSGIICIILGLLALLAAWM